MLFSLQKQQQLQNHNAKTKENVSKMMLSGVSAQISTVEHGVSTGMCLKYVQLLN